MSGLEVVKHGHACLTLVKDGRRLVIDPGVWTEPEALAGADAVLVTHEHPDHVDQGALRAALADRPELEVWTNPAFEDVFEAPHGRMHVVEDGDTFEAAGFSVRAVGDWHAEVHADVPRILAASVAAVPPVVLLAITHLTVILTRTPETDTKAPAVASFSTVAAEAMPALLSGDAELSAHDEGTAATDRRARGRELREAGWSNKRIARELGVHPSTVGRWFAVAHLIDTTDTADEREETTP